MAFARKHKGTWCAKWKDAAGHWREKRTNYATKAQAVRLAQDLERQAERQRFGLEPLPTDAPRTTFADAVKLWWDEYASKLRSHGALVSHKDLHLLPALGSLPLAEVTPGRIEALLNSKSDALAPETVNKLRSTIRRIFNIAAKRGLWRGPNPVREVEKRKVPRRLPRFLREDEVEPLLRALAPEWRSLFATAIYTGMRKGELLGLQRPEVDLAAGTIAVARSWDRDTTKGGHADLIPIADGLRPFIVAALNASPSEFVFPRADGKMHNPTLKLDVVLRRALKRAGLVSGYVHKCRRCGHSESASDQELRRCPKCKMKLWPKPVPKDLTFHSLRHTAATLLLKAGVPLETVRRLLRHSDPKLTADVYGHLEVEDIRAGVNRLPSFADLAPTVPAVEELRAVAGERGPDVAPVWHVPRSDGEPSGGENAKPYDSGDLQWRAWWDSDPRPLASEANTLSS